MDAQEILDNGILLKEKDLRQRCADCDEFLTAMWFRYKGKKNRKVVACKKCGTASWINKKSQSNVRKVRSVDEMLENRSKKR